MRHVDDEKDAWLPAGPRLVRAAEPLRSSLFRDTTAAAGGDDGIDGYVEVYPGRGGYLLRDREGRCPEDGDLVDGEDGVEYVVLKVGRSPLPNDTRRCVYLELRAARTAASAPPPVE